MLRGEIMRKIKRILAIIMLMLALYLFIIDEIEYSKLSFEEKALIEMNFDAFVDERPVDKIVFTFDTGDGYICVATSSKDELVHYGFLEKKGRKLSLEGKCFFSFPLIVYNEDPTQLFTINVLDSDNDYFFGCYQHKENVKIIANNNEIETHSFELTYSGENYKMDFWFLCSAEEPDVLVKETQGTVD